MALFGPIETVRAQAPRTAVFETAWQYIHELMQPGSAAHRRLAELPRGQSHKEELSHGVFAIEQVYDTKPRSAGFFESHRKYIDIQVVVSGHERMEVIDRTHITEREAYQPERDLTIHADSAAASVLHVGPGDAAIFFPPDVHMPSLSAGTAAVLVRKSVLKLPVSS